MPKNTAKYAPVTTEIAPEYAPVKAKKPRKLPAEILSRDEVRDLLAACSRRAPSGIRNRALIALIYRSGLRIGEALALKPSHINAEAGTVRVLHGKGDKARTVAVDAQTLDTLTLWLDTRKELKIGPTKPLFCQITKGKAGQSIDDSYIRHLLARLRDKAGIDKRVHAHGLRHTYAVELLEEGEHVKGISQMLGHSNVATTNTYLDRLKPHSVIERLRTRTW